MRDSNYFKELQSFERYLLMIATKCEYAYGAMGRVGFLYESMKDQLRWNKLSVKHYVTLLSRVGGFMALDDEQFKKEKRKRVKVEAANSLMAAFGDGK